jgi:hypothetical protein
VSPLASGLYTTTAVYRDIPGGVDEISDVEPIRDVAPGPLQVDKVSTDNTTDLA